MRLVQVLFETHLRGLFAPTEVVFHPAEAVDIVPGRSRRPFGKFKEVVSVRFGSFDLTLKSANEMPPLGCISLVGPGGEVEEESLDTLAFDRIGKTIKTQHERIASHV